MSADEAERFARHYELYTPTGLDLNRAKRLIADNRKEMAKVARQVAEEAVAPMRQTTALQASRQNFVWAASQRRADGQPLVSPETLAKQWANFPHELTADPQVARVVLAAAIGESLISGHLPIQAPEQEPVATEPPGGARYTMPQISAVEQRVARAAGLSEKQYAETAKLYQPGAINTLGD